MKTLLRLRRCIYFNNFLRYKTTQTLVEDPLEETSKFNNCKTFKELLDESKLMKFGRADNKCVVGKIVDVCNDDLYVDFGAKLEAVVKRPTNDTTGEYKIGTLVRLILKKFEMTGQFLGDNQHITLNEAHAILIGQYKENSKSSKSDNL